MAWVLAIYEGSKLPEVEVVCGRGRRCRISPRRLATSLHFNQALRAAGEPATSLCFRANVVLSCRYTPVRRLSMCDIESKKKEGTIKILIILIM